jgi:hypothetical protein
MYDIKAHEVVYRGAHFRSKNECKRYIFFKQLGWNVEYEPVLEDIKGWLPDFAIYGDKNKKILVEVKPYQTMIMQSQWRKKYTTVVGMEIMILF